MQKTITGRRIVGGKAEGQAVVTTVPLCFRTEYDPRRGKSSASNIR